MPKLTVCIPTTIDRREMFQALLDRVCSLAPDNVEVIYCEDDKEMSIGAKRQVLIDNVKGEYVVMIDSDDDISDDYFTHVMPALAESPDCIGYYEEVRGKTISKAKHSIQCKYWSVNPIQRTPFYKTPIRTELARQIGFRDMRYGEDKRFADSILPLLKTEIFIDQVMYIYNQPENLTPQQHRERYGIK